MLAGPPEARQIGERLVLGPLFGNDLSPTGLPSRITKRTLRFAWHLTSVALLGLVGVVAGLEPGLVVAAVCFGPAAALFFGLRRHLAWPLFLIAGIAALVTADAVPETLAKTLGWLSVVGLLAVAGLHLYWVGGGRWLADTAIPTDDDKPMFQPPKLLTASVAITLVVFASLLAATFVGLNLADSETPRQVLAWIGVGVLGLRAVGDGRFVGFTKTRRQSKFAEADDRFFTPIVVLLMVGSATGLLLG